jgi:hypothetical protein
MTHDRAASGFGAEPPTVAGALRRIVRDPIGQLLRKWNWKSALTSSLFRAPIFFFANLSAGRKAAVGAFLSELVLRSATSGFYGSLTESIRDAEPAWLAALTAVLLMPLVNHSLELLVHWLRSTPRLLHSIVASVCFTAISTLFNLYVMRRGALIVGKERQSFAQDMRCMPRLLIGFLAAGPLAALHWLKCRGARAISLRTKPDWENEGG